MCSITAGSEVLMPGTAMRSLSEKSLSDLMLGLRVIRYNDDELIPDKPRISSAGLSFAFAHSVRKPGTPIEAMSSAPDSIASLMTLPPSSTTYVALTSPRPAVLAFFSTSFSLAMTISGR